ncbi:ABC transporter permease [Demetria terragena]|uniref:ABC transporter permease n=1 Tax=Demetria terragena TaxID=63959 RepID=UPI000366178E|nr:ABC transporter permease [Demetria terragena]
MSAQLTLATARRILAQLRADPRTIALIVVVPSALITLLYFVYNGSPAFDRIAVSMLGILPMLVMFLITSIAMLRERTSGTLERLLTTPLHRADLLLGYGIAFSVMAGIQSLALWAITRWALGVETAGPMWWLLAVAAASAGVGVATGLLASAFSRTEFQAVQLMPIFIGPQIFLCGLLAARDSMPDLLQWVSNALPMTYAVEALGAIATTSQPGSEASTDIAILCGFALAALACAAASMPRQTR